MGSKRSYADGCAAAHALDLVGERWALLVVRELVLGPKRFTDLRAALPGISPNVLSQRLDELERVGVIRRLRLPPPAGSWVYEATEWGLELEPILRQLGRWGARSPYLDRTAALSVGSFVLSLRTMFDSAAAVGFTGTYEIRMGEERFQAEVADGTFRIERGGGAADVVLESDPGTLAGLTYDGHDLDEVVAAGRLRYTGDRSTVERFFTLFTLPTRAG